MPIRERRLTMKKQSKLVSIVARVVLSAVIIAPLVGCYGSSRSSRSSNHRKRHVVVYPTPSRYHPRIPLPTPQRPYYVPQKPRVTYHNPLNPHHGIPSRPHYRPTNPYHRSTTRSHTRSPTRKSTIQKYHEAVKKRQSTYGRTKQHGSQRSKQGRTMSGRSQGHSKGMQRSSLRR